MDSIKAVGSATREGRYQNEAIQRGRDLPERVQSSVRQWYEIAEDYFEKQNKICRSDMPWQETFWKVVSAGLFETRWVTSEDVPDFETFRTSDFDEWGGNSGWAYDSEIYKTLNLNTIEQCFFITETGYMGTGPPTLVPGDEVLVLCGGRVPFLLRRLEGTSLNRDGADTVVFHEGMVYHEVLGDGYVNGIMHGEVMREDDMNLRQVHIV